MEPRCSSIPRSSRGSACRSSRRWRAARRSSPRRTPRWTKRAGTRRCASTRSTSRRSPRGSGRRSRAATSSSRSASPMRPRFSWRVDGRDDARGARGARVSGNRRPEEVAIAVRRPAGEYLVLLRSPEKLGYWHLVSGGVDWGEEPAAAAARELLEETGLVAVPGAARRSARLRPRGRPRTGARTVPGRDGADRRLAVRRRGPRGLGADARPRARRRALARLQRPRSRSSSTRSRRRSCGGPPREGRDRHLPARPDARRDSAARARSALGADGPARARARRAGGRRRRTHRLRPARRALVPVPASDTPRRSSTSSTAPPSARPSRRARRSSSPFTTSACSGTRRRSRAGTG